MKTRIRLAFFLLFCLFTYQILALPRFAVRLNEKCQNCHIDPNGGGMRNYYGSIMYGKGVLPANIWDDDSTIINLTNHLSDFISFGTDVRTLYFRQQQNNYSSFYQMQADIYLSIRLAKNTLLYIDKGLQDKFEVFGLMNVLPANGYLKIGRFTPAYGTKIDDHTAFIRHKTVFHRYHREDTGFEVGISPSFLTWNVGIFNGEDGSDFSNGKIRLITSRAEAKMQFDNLKFSVGGSAWLNNSVAGKYTMFGGFGSVSYEGFTVNGEVDFKRDKSALNTNEFISYLECNYLVTDGVDLKFMFDFYDPDVKYATGTESRYSFGLEFFPMNGVEFRPMYRILKEKPFEIRNDEFDFLIHFYL